MFDHENVPISCKSAIVIPLFKKLSLDREMLKYYRPVSNLSFLSKVIYFVCTMILSQPLAKAMNHFYFFLDLSAAFDTIDHDNVFYILEKYVGICGSALRLIRSYFCDRTQRVQIDGVMSGEKTTVH